MGFLSLFKSNFTRIAENTSKYYLELTRNYSNRFYDEVTLLSTVGILDAQVYVFVEHSISLETIIGIAKQAVAKEKEDPSSYHIMALQEKHKRYMKSPVDLLSGSFEEKDDFEKDTLFNFIFSLEVEIFAVESPRLHRSRIERACYEKASTIFKAIRRTKERYNSEVPFALATANLMNLPKFEAIRKQLGIRE